MHLSLEEIATETGADPGLRALRAALKTNCRNSDIVKPFRINIKDEITIDYMNDILLRGTRIIVPVSLRKHTIKLAHYGHQGLCKTKSLLWEHVWFPGMDKLVKEEIDQCIPCQATGQPTPQNRYAQLQCQMDHGKRFNIDFKGPLPSGHYLLHILVIIDSYSRTPRSKSYHQQPHRR